LIKPVQRLPRYQLLVQELLRHCPLPSIFLPPALRRHLLADRAALADTLACVKRIAQTVDRATAAWAPVAGVAITQRNLLAAEFACADCAATVRALPANALAPSAAAATIAILGGAGGAGAEGGTGGASGGAGEGSTGNSGVTSLLSGAGGGGGGTSDEDDASLLVAMMGPVPLVDAVSAGSGAPTGAAAVPAGTTLWGAAGMLACPPTVAAGSSAARRLCCPGCGGTDGHAGVAGGGPCCWRCTAGLRAGRGGLVGTYFASLCPAVAALPRLVAPHRVLVREGALLIAPPRLGVRAAALLPWERLAATPGAGADLAYLVRVGVLPRAACPAALLRMVMQMSSPPSPTALPATAEGVAEQAHAARPAEVTFGASTLPTSLAVLRAGISAPCPSPQQKPPGSGSVVAAGGTSTAACAVPRERALPEITRDALFFPTRPLATLAYSPTAAAAAALAPVSSLRAPPVDAVAPATEPPRLPGCELPVVRAVTASLFNDSLVLAERIFVPDDAAAYGRAERDYTKRLRQSIHEYLRWRRRHPVPDTLVFLPAPVQAAENATAPGAGAAGAPPAASTASPGATPANATPGATDCPEWPTTDPEVLFAGGGAGGAANGSGGGACVSGHWVARLIEAVPLALVHVVDDGNDAPDGTSSVSNATASTAVDERVAPAPVPPSPPPSPTASTAPTGATPRMPAPSLGAAAAARDAAFSLLTPALPSPPPYALTSGPNLPTPAPLLSPPPPPLQPPTRPQPPARPPLVSAAWVHLRMPHRDYFLRAATPADAAAWRAAIASAASWALAQFAAPAAHLLVQADGGEEKAKGTDRDEVEAGRGGAPGSEEDDKENGVQGSVDEPSPVCVSDDKAAHSSTGGHIKEGARAPADGAVVAPESPTISSPLSSMSSALAAAPVSGSAVEVLMATLEQVAQTHAALLRTLGDAPLLHKTRGEAAAEASTGTPAAAREDEMRRLCARLGDELRACREAAAATRKASVPVAVSAITAGAGAGADVKLPPLVSETATAASLATVVTVPAVSAVGVPLKVVPLPRMYDANERFQV